MLEICIDTTQYIQPNRIFISIKLELMQENNHFLSWQLIFGKTFHHKKKDWLDQLVDHWNTMREVSGLSPRPDQHSGS